MAASRRTRTQVEVPIPPSNNHNSDSLLNTSKMNSTTAKPTASDTRRFSILPSTLETIILATYPAILVLGSIYSALHPSTRNATYNAEVQSYDQATAPSYFAKKSNVFNVYFVKIGWFWITLAFTVLLLPRPTTSTSTSPTTTTTTTLTPTTRHRLQSLFRYTLITTSWILMTQWCFGAPIIDRTYRWTGGQCKAVHGSSPSDALAREEMSEVREVVTHAACKAIGGTWAGGHDISGHVFLLILGSGMLVFEALPWVVGRRKGAGGAGERVALAVAAFCAWMLLMTAAYFHTWFEKLTGLAVAFVTLFVVYFVPRGVREVREVVGVPGL